MNSLEYKFVSTIAELNANNQQITFAELINKIWNGKLVEVYIGDTYEDVKLEESSSKYASVLIGKVVAAYAECLVLNCAYVEGPSRQQEIKLGSIVCLNERAIRTITVVDKTGVLKDTFINSKGNAGKLLKNLIEEND